MPSSSSSNNPFETIGKLQGFGLQSSAEVRLYAAGTRKLLGTRLVDSGSSYNAQSDMPVHFGLPTTGRVDIEVIWPSGGRRAITRTRYVDPHALRGRVAVVKVGR